MRIPTAAELQWGGLGRDRQGNEEFRNRKRKKSSFDQMVRHAKCGAFTGAPKSCDPLRRGLMSILAQSQRDLIQNQEEGAQEDEIYDVACVDHATAEGVIVR